MGARIIFYSLLPALWLFCGRPAHGQKTPPGFVLTTVTDQLDSKSVGIALLPDNRILVINHQSGHMELVVGDSVRVEPLLTIENLVFSSEQGLLGVAVDPDFPDSNFVYLFSSRADKTNRVSRYTFVGALDDSASFDLSIDSASERILFAAPDTTRFHNGGTLRFGRDKTLYISMGDDAQANRVQNLGNLYGKILRLNRDGSTPDDNPVFPGDPGGRRGEVFAMGLRNPFRFSIDPLNDALFIGDVGTNLYEEFNVSRGGENFGYPRYEGPGFFREYEQLIDPAPTFPVFDYPYSTRGRAAIALLTYRQMDAPTDRRFPDEYEGAHFFTDFFSDELRYLTDGWDVHTFGDGFSQLIDAALAPDGSVYLLSYRGRLFKLTYEGSQNVALEKGNTLEDARVSQNYPNPFRGETNISYTLTAPDRTIIEVFDVLGRKIETLVDGWQAPGSYSVRFEANGLPPGVYLLRFGNGRSFQSKKMTLLGG